MLLIPAIDLRGGQCVRLLQGRFDAETVYASDPLEVLERYLTLGARQVHVVDLDGARDGSQGNRAVIGRIAGRAGRGAIQVGGGVRTREVAAWLQEFGPERVVLAFDVRLDEAGTPHLATHGWERQTQTSLWDAVERYLPAGLRHVLCTDVARDGALSGPNVPLYAECVRRYPEIAWQASGGVSSAADLHELAATGATAVISGRALLEGRLTAEELQPFLPAA